MLGKGKVGKGAERAVPTLVSTRFHPRWARRALPTLLLFAAGIAHGQTTIEYRTVAEAREALLAKPGATAKDEQGWLVVSEADTMWTFAPVSHEAHPAVAKRAIVQRDGKLYLEMAILCEASKEACDRLLEAFNQLNAQMMRAMQSGQ